MSALADRFPTVSRHWQVLRESWQAQDLADKAFRPRDEHAFLPAALEIIETPPSPGLRWLLLATCGLFVLALVWAVFGKLDVVAVASGKTVPSGSVKVVQPVEIGTVRAIHVVNGQFVRKGQLLLELDPTLANAEEAQSEQTLLAAQVIQARNDALLAHLEGRPARFVPPPGTPDNVIRTEDTFVRTAIAEFDAKRASLLQQRAEKQADLAATRAEIAKLTEAVPYIDQQMAARVEMADKGYYSKLKLLEYQQARQEHLRDIDVQTANAAKARASIGTLDAELRSLREGFGKTAATEQAEANDKAGLASEELHKSARRREYQEMRAPVDGVVQQLAVTTIGGVVQPAQPLMLIVPCQAGAAQATRCNGSIAVDAFVQNKDIGFVKTGQRVAVKLEAFNFTDYGLIEGKVETISRDAIDQSQQPAGSARDAGGRPVQPGLVYAARIVLACAPGDPRRTPLCDQMQPGMAVQAEIKTGHRRIIKYLLSPITQALDEAGHER